jgi:integrase
VASIQKRGDNSFLLVVEAGYKANGKRNKKTRTIRIDDKKLLGTKKRLNDYLDLELAKFQMEVEEGEYISPEKMRFDSFVEVWKEKYAVDTDNLSPASYDRYLGVINTHITPYFTNMRLDEIKTFHIVTFFDELKKAGARKDGRGEYLSGGTRAYIYRVLKNIMSRATEWKLIKQNPVEGVSKPKETKAAPQFYDSDESLKVIDALYSEPVGWRLYFLGALFGGFRRGELLALEWPDINFDECTINVDESISLTKNGKAIVSSPKTESSNAEVDMPQWYMKELRLYRMKWLEERMAAPDQWEGGEKDYVFHSGLGKPYFYDTPTKRWSKFLKKHGLKHTKLHALRHTTAVLLLEEDVPLKDIQERLRHSKYQTTADIYSHITKKKRKDTASKFDKYNPRKNG